MYKHSGKAAILTIAALCCATTMEAQQWLLESPEKILSMKVSQSTSDGLAFSVTYKGESIAEASSIGLTIPTPQLLADKTSSVLKSTSTKAS